MTSRRMWTTRPPRSHRLNPCACGGFMPITMSMVLSTATRFACEWAAAPRRARQAEPSHLARRAPQMPLNAVRNSAAVLNPGRWSIRTQLMVFCVVIAVVPLLVLEYVDNARARESLAQGTDKAMLLTAQSTAATIDRLNEDRLQMATQIAANSLVSAKAAGLEINSEPLLLAKLLDSCLKSNSSFTAVYFTDK